jgi:SAM-dependent methyltransferase
LEAGHSVIGVDLSAEMVERAEIRCGRFGTRALFRQGSIHESLPEGPFDAAVTRLVLHHIENPAQFVHRVGEICRPGGIVVICDHTTDPNPKHAAWHNKIERLRDKTHTYCLTPGAIVDLMANVGLDDIRAREEAFALDFDEWFDRGTPAAPKDEVKAELLTGPGARGFRPVGRADGTVQIHGTWIVARGCVPASRNLGRNPGT